MSERFERVYRAHVRAVLRFAASCVGRADVAEDLTSEAFIALLQNLDAIDDAHALGWLIAVVRNRARDRWRHVNVEQRHLNTLAPEPTVEPVLEGASLIENESLKPVHRLCLRLRYVEGMSRSEISSITGLSDNQVKGALQYALRLLRQVVEEGSR